MVDALRTLELANDENATLLTMVLSKCAIDAARVYPAQRNPSPQVSNTDSQHYRVVSALDARGGIT